MGRVVQARDRVLDLPVALKVVRPELAADERFSRRFEREVRVAARFHHPHIVPLHDYGRTREGFPFLGMALADAGSFASLRHEEAAWPEVLRLTLELLSALAHLHARDVLHRDLKPENVLLYTADDGLRHVWLADLGLAGAGSMLARRRGRTEGTPGFMAPEQALGLPRDYGPWTDLYGVGVMLWELVSGRRPFADDEGPHTRSLPALIPQVPVPRQLDIVLGNLLQAEPLARYDLAADLRTELLALGAPDEGRLGSSFTYAGAGETVAVGALALAADSDDDDDDEQSTLYHLSGDGLGTRFTPHWHRPLPPKVPKRAPPEAGQGARARASLPLFALREIPLVARDEHRTLLWKHARAVAAQASGRVVVVVGEAGCGKSHLISAVVRALEEGGWAESVTLSFSQESSPDDGYAGAARGLLRPWNETRQSLEARLRRRLAREHGRLDTEVKAEVDALVRWCGLLEEGEEPAPGGVALREVYRFLEARSWRRLACLVIDDAQWGREEGDGLAIPEALLERWEERQESLLVIVAVREEDLASDQALAERVQGLFGRGAHRVDVPRLDAAGVSELLDESLSLTTELAEQVVARCEGNPLFARQLLLEWADRGWLVDAGGLRFQLRGDVDADAVLPADAQGLLTDRIQRFALESGSERRFRDAVHLAALSGRSVPWDLVAGFLGPELVEFAQGCGLWTRVEDRLEFDNALLHQAALVAAQQRPDNRYLHRRLGRAWVSIRGERGVVVSHHAGRHAALAGDLGFAMPHLTRAAEHAWHGGRSGDLDEVTTLALAATTEHAELQHRWAADAYLWRARACELAGETADAAALYALAHDAFARVGRPTPRTEALLGQAWAVLRSGDLDAAEVLFEQVIEEARTSGAGHLEARAVAGTAWVGQQRRDFSGAAVLFTRALARLSRERDVAGIAQAQLGQAFVARRTGDFEEAREIYDEAGDSFREVGDLLGEVRATLGLATVARLQTHNERCEELLRQALSTAEELGATPLAMEARLGFAELARFGGDGDRARELYQRIATWAEGQEVFESALVATLGLSRCDLDADDLDGAYAHANRAVEHLERVPGHWLWAAYRLLVATLLAKRGDHTGTWKWLWAASKEGIGETIDPDVASCLTTICDIAAERQWANVLRMSGQMATEQLDRLGHPERSREVRERVTSGLI